MAGISRSQAGGAGASMAHRHGWPSVPMGSASAERAGLSGGRRYAAHRRLSRSHHAAGTQDGRHAGAAVASP